MTPPSYETNSPASDSLGSPDRRLGGGIRLALLGAVIVVLMIARDVAL